MKIKREIECHISRLSRQYPLVTLMGPRQSGKTTLARTLFPEKPYLSLENTDLRKRATDDPNSFLRSVKEGAILDEIQNAPDLLSYLQTDVDLDPRPGRFILTGSAQLQMLDYVSQSLAGRTALATLLPFSMQEAYPDSSRLDVDQLLYAGFYPRIFDQHLNPTEVLAAYHTTYVERDVRAILQIRDWSKFDTFLRLCAGRTANLLNIDTLGGDAGVSHGAAREWLSALEASYLIFRLRPHFNNLNKRLIKAPKLHFIDCGLAAYLMQIDDPRQLATHPLRGSLFESFVVAEFLKQRFNNIKTPNLYFWRDNVGHEIDMLLDFGTAVLPVEIKSGETVNDEMVKNLHFYRKHNPASKKAALIYGGSHTYVKEDIWIISYRDIGLFSSLDHTLEFPQIQK